MAALLLGTAVGLVNAPAFAGNIVDTVRDALASNPEVGIVRHDRRAVEQELRQARARWFPSLDAELRYGPEWAHNDTARSRDGDDSSVLARREASLSLRQLLFDGFETQAEIERQRARLDSAARRVAETAEFVALDAVQAHLEVLRRQGIVDLAERNVKRHEEIVARVRRMEREGRVSVADLRQAEARLAQAREDLARARGDLEDAVAGYLQVVGKAPENLILDPVPDSALPRDREEAASLARSANPRVLIAYADVAVAEAELKKARSGYYPQVEVRVEGAYGEGVAGNPRPAGNASALLVLRQNLYRGGADMALEREAFHRLNEARARLDRARRLAEQDARTSWNALETARARVEALQAKAEAQRRTRDAYFQQFEIGQRSLLDLLDAENELFLSRVLLRTAEFTERFAVYRVLAATGRLLSTLDVAPPREHMDIERRPEDEPTPSKIEEKARELDDPRMEARPVRGAESGEPPREDYDVTPHTGRPPERPVEKLDVPAGQPGNVPAAGGGGGERRPTLFEYLWGTGSPSAAAPATSATRTAQVPAAVEPAAAPASATGTVGAMETAARAPQSPSAPAPERPQTLAAMLQQWFGRGGE